jgi:hypothetical protein
MTDLVRYDAMCSAIAECHSVDEVKDLRDKAMALELYARQARNTDAERKASEVRLRAERRTGELLKELDRSTPVQAGAEGGAAKAGRVAPASVAGASPYRRAIEQAQIPERTAQRYQALANVPTETFERALREPVKPTTTGILEKAKPAAPPPAPQPRISDEALWIWGRARDFERDGYLAKDPAVLLAEMTDTMRADMVRIVPLMAEFFSHFTEVFHEHA